MMMPMSTAAVVILSLVLSLLVPSLHAFAPAVALACPSSGITSSGSITSASTANIVRCHQHQQHQPLHPSVFSPIITTTTTLAMKIDQKRRKQLGIADDEEEYDLDKALSANTDAGITKIIAGSFILVMIALLVVGLV
jgi:hypothetical protein